jgi:hypothetical protein
VTRSIRSHGSKKMNAQMTLQDLDKFWDLSLLVTVMRYRCFFNTIPGDEQYCFSFFLDQNEIPRSCIANDTIQGC